MKKKEILERQQIEVEKKNKEEADQLNKKIIKLKTKCKKAGGVLVPFSSPTDVMWSCVKSDLFIDVGTLDEK
ncbi:MAG TPA: hypothetical protein VMW91_00560 [Desulfosporosinus sp.]|nr:hypothetical protein [Desulfosporosinus sp.]